MESSSGGGPHTGWAAIRPVLVAFLLVADAVVVAALGLSQKRGWVPPFIAFSVILVGLVWFEGWAVAHRHDDDR
ncbi:MAG: hypothetical protein JST31_06520 [Actinobacteria bacterium]|nr:hypothetical protein [Actinomycetota bacterium]